MSYYELPSQYCERIDEYNRLHSRNDSLSEDYRRPRSPRRTRSPRISISPRQRCPQLSPELSSERFYEYRREKRETTYWHSRSKVSDSDFPVVRSQPANEYRPKMEPEIKKVNGQFYCEPCDTYCARYDVMQAHLSGKVHKKNTKQIARYACDLCLIEVSSAETLQTHMNGMSHIKRAKVAEEAKKEKEYFGPRDDETDELDDLRTRCSKLERQNANLQKEVDQLLKFKKNCLSNHNDIKMERYPKY